MHDGSMHDGFKTTLRGGAALLVLLSAAAGCALEPLTPPVDCSVTGKNEQLFSLMTDVYLWSDEVSFVDPSTYPSPEALLDDLRYKELDRWSYVTAREPYDAYHNEGLQLGLGYRLKYDAEHNVRFSLVQPGSPAAQAGIKRGDKLLAVGDKTVADIEKGALWAEVMGEDKADVEVTFTFEDATSAVRTITLLKQWYAITTTPIVKTLDIGSRKVGYLVYGAFRRGAELELLDAFATLKANKVEDLILDLRYNGGGGYDVAVLLASLVRGGPSTEDLFGAYFHNERYSDWDTWDTFYPLEGSLGLPRVFILVTGATASASEVFINSLRPYIDVKLVGSTTHGKPVGMYAYEHCDIVMVPITVRTVNADGEGDFYDGFEPDCFAEDGLTAELGSEDEPSLAEAIHLLQNGSCSAPAPDGGPASKREAPAREIPLQGLQRVIGSF